ncbi:hypothetical protein FB107DRAFT_255907 [Schizophyllum commune]
MPPRSTPPPSRAYVPQNDAATYRDLLLFEERLKSNAEFLQKRKSRYQFFLIQLLLIIALLLSEVLFMSPDMSLLAIPYRFVLRKLLPDVYGDGRDATLTIHPFLASGMLFVSVTTLVLFFASGMYAEKIAYANKYVPHANRALRSFNIFLNVRRPPLRTKFLSNPLSFLFERPDDDAATRPRSRSPSSARSKSPTGTLPIPTIPPAQNPRGELIFSSKVDRGFREGYERYRAAFEKRRQEKERMERARRWWGRLWFWRKPPPAPVPASGQPAPRSRTPSGMSAASSTTSRRGGGSRSGTPPATPPRGDPRRTPRQRGTSPPTGSTPERQRARYSRDLDADMRTVALERSTVGFSMG